MKKIILMILILAISLAGLSFAQPNNKRTPKHDRLMDALKLTDAQEKQFNDIQFAHKEKVIEFQADLKKNRLEVQKMMRDNEVDAGKLTSLTKANSDIKAKMQESRVKMWLDINKILNAEQKEIWADHFSRMGNGEGIGRGKRFNCRMDGKFGNGMGRGFRNRDRF